MSLSVEAKLFYGYHQSAADREVYREMDSNLEDTPWSAIHTKKAHGCVGGIHGYDENLGFFLAVEEALYVTEWNHVFHLTSQNFEIKSAWDEQLHQAAMTFGLDLTGLQPGWYLVCLYF